MQPIIIYESETRLHASQFPFHVILNLLCSWPVGYAGKSNLILATSSTGQNEKHYTSQYVKQTNPIVRVSKECFEFTSRMDVLTFSQRIYQYGCNVSCWIYYPTLCPLHRPTHLPGVISDVSEVSP